MKRVVKAMKQVAVPIGSAGVFYKEFKLNYLFQVASYTLTLLIAGKEMHV